MKDRDKIHKYLIENNVAQYYIVFDNGSAFSFDNCKLKNSYLKHIITKNKESKDNHE